MKPMYLVNLGLTDYKSTWDLQRAVFEIKTEKKLHDVLFLNEHHHVYTLGKSSDANHLLSSKDELRAMNASVFEIDRGGDVTYHGPGQLVGYPILDLNNYYPDIHRYLREIEEAIIRTLAEFGIPAQRDEEFTGVWVGSDKIAAIGVKVSRWITMHGFALNVNTDLSYFDRIIPCGIFHKGVTSMEVLTGKKQDMNEVAQVFVQKFCEVFGVSVETREKGEFLESVNQLSKEISECNLPVNLRFQQT